MASSHAVEENMTDEKTHNEYVGNMLHKPIATNILIKQTTALT